jgi:hypothetical protein
VPKGGVLRLERWDLEIQALRLPSCDGIFSFFQLLDKEVPMARGKKQEEFYLGKYLIALYQADDDDTLVAVVSNTKELAERLGRSQDSISASFAHHQKLFRFDSIPCKVHLIEA